MDGSEFVFIFLLMVYVIGSGFFRVFNSKFFFLRSSMQMWLPLKTDNMVALATLFWPLWFFIHRYYQRQLDKIPGYVEKQKNVDDGE